MLKAPLEKLLGGQSLSRDEAARALESVLIGADSHQTAALLALLRAKGETAAELAGMTETMRRHMVPVAAKGVLIDTCGTGGDGAHTVNISTGAAILAAACGAVVAKHGNRSVSSKCGSADVLEALGVAVDLPPEGVERCISEAGIGFMFAPIHHPAMKAVVPVRKGLGLRTAFNMLGPLLNPAGARRQVIGVYNPEVMDLMADTLLELGTDRAMVLHGQGMDELTPVGSAEVIEIVDGKKERRTVDPGSLGLPRCSVADLNGGDAQENAHILRDVLGGQDGPVARALALNAAAALVVAEKVPDLQEALETAKEVLASGLALETLDRWAAVSRSVKGEANP